jgi:hypothetical protein
MSSSAVTPTSIHESVLNASKRTITVMGSPSKKWKYFEDIW